jgi:hypothetical protein
VCVRGARVYVCGVCVFVRACVCVCVVACVHTPFVVVLCGDVVVWLECRFLVCWWYLFVHVPHILVLQYVFT